MPFIRGSSNGRTAAFEAVNLGSSPNPRNMTSWSCFGKTSNHQSLQRHDPKSHSMAFCQVAHYL